MQFRLLLVRFQVEHHAFGQVFAFVGARVVAPAAASHGLFRIVDALFVALEVGQQFRIDLAAEVGLAFGLIGQGQVVQGVAQFVNGDALGGFRALGGHAFEGKPQ